MIDALLYAARDWIRAANIGYGAAECDIMDDGRPPPVAGNWFVSIHGGKSSPGPANERNYDANHEFCLTLTGRVTISLDRVGSQMIARNVSLVPLAQRQGFNAKLDQLIGLIHSNWAMVVKQDQAPNSANDNIAAWATGAVYGFTTPVKWQGHDFPTLVGSDWFGAEPDDDKFGLKAEVRFGGARRMQPQTAAQGPFV